MSRSERLTAQFYDWEVRGRGWDVWPRPVDLEPQFRPFLGHTDHTASQAVDDGRKPTLLSSIVEGIEGVLRPSTTRHPEEQEVASGDAQYEPIWFEAPDEVAAVRVALPQAASIQKAGYERFLSGLGRLSRPAAFELVGRHDAINVQFAGAPADLGRLRLQLSGYLPEAICLNRERALEAVWNRSKEPWQLVVEFGLGWEFMRPLRRLDRFDPDPLAGLVAAMATLESEDVAVYQVLFRPVVNRWTESILRAVGDGRGGSFFADDPAMVRLAGQKVAAPLYAVVVRIAVQSNDAGRAEAIATAMGSSLYAHSDPVGNELVPFPNGFGYEQQDLDLRLRQSRRSGMLLNADELIALAHPPSASVREAKLVRYAEKTRPAPEVSQGNDLHLGYNDHAGRSTVVSLSASQRLKHLWLLGASGSGKSTLLLRMILHGVRNGEGVAVLEPHGDLVDEVLCRIPESRMDDVILVDPSEEESSMGLNVLAAHSETEKNLLESDLVSVFRRLSTSWGDQMTTILGNAVFAFLESTEGGTLADLRRFLVEPSFREEVLRSVADDEVVYFWRNEFPLLRGKPQSPILTRLNTFLRPKPIRRMVTQREKSLDFSAIMADRKILLAKLSQGLIGEENSHLLGTLFVTKLNQAATARQRLDQNRRSPFYLYVDEFQNFITPSMSAILSGARKYGLGFVLAHKDLQQVASRDAALTGALISNPYTRICFRLGDFDARRLEDGFSSFSAQDLQNLSVGRAVCRMERAEFDFNLRTEAIEPLDPATAAERRRRVRERSFALYAARRTIETVTPASKVASEGAPKVKLPGPASRERVSPPRSESGAPQALGRGGPQHQYLQQLVKRWAEANGYRATIEQPVLDGLGSVDVALSRGDYSLACEICISTSPEHELDNIRKCLAAGFDHVAVLSTTRKSLDRIAGVADDLEKNERARVRFCLPEELFAFLEEGREAHSDQTVQTVRGYRVTVTHRELSPAEREAKKSVIAAAVVKSLRRLPS